jgi:hypothetical protein
MSRGAQSSAFPGNLAEEPVSPAKSLIAKEDTRKSDPTSAASAEGREGPRGVSEHSGPQAFDAQRSRDRAGDGRGWMRPRSLRRLFNVAERAQRLSVARRNQAAVVENPIAAPLEGVRRQNFSDQRWLLLRDGSWFQPRPPLRPGTPFFSFALYAA